MDIEQLIEGLSRHSSYPHLVEAIEVRQTHISLVFLAGEFVFKLRKPVQFDFLDFSTLENRHQDCLEEVRLNRRLAPQVYLGVVRVVQSSDGLKFSEEGEAIEWAVKMHRLPDSASLLEHLQRQKITLDEIEQLASVLADFHSKADGGEKIAAFGRLEVVARNARENFDQSEAEVGVTVSRQVFDRLRELTEFQFKELGSLIEARAERGVPRDTHGDLHLDHIYLLPDQSKPNNLIAIDCIEFNERFRYSDPVADMAFLVMDFKYRGRVDLAEAFARAYFERANDSDGKLLLPFYTSYRAIVRAKVEGMTLRESEVPIATREKNRQQARAHWLLALNELEEAARRPVLLLIGGLPGTGKSTLAKELATDGFDLIRTDVVRKEMLYRQLNPISKERLYSSEVSTSVYEECLSQAEKALMEGRKVIVDGNFREEAHRKRFLELSRSLCVPIRLIICTSDAEVVRSRLANRKDDASDADWSVYVWAAEHWETPDAAWNANALSVSTDLGTDLAATTVRKWIKVV
jgi:uncharacterized protein